MPTQVQLRDFRTNPWTHHGVAMEIGLDGYEREVDLINTTWDAQTPWDTIWIGHPLPEEDCMRRDGQGLAGILREMQLIQNDILTNFGYPALGWSSRQRTITNLRWVIYSREQRTREEEANRRWNEARERNRDAAQGRGLEAGGNALETIRNWGNGARREEGRDE